MMVLVYYLLKVLICSGCLFLYYHLALKNKVFHQWNRFYLLSAVVLSLLLPLLQITVWHTWEEETKAIQLIQVVQSADNYLEEFTVTNNKNISPEKWIAAGYGIICFGLLMSLLVSVLKIVAIIRSHAGQWLHNIRFINTNEPGTPFSFFHFIFWNKDISLQSQTGQQIFRHELVHVQEKHTLDKLFMQVILILFWCNPFFWLIRRELKFIHEFIADKKAAGEQGTAAFAAMILQTAYPQHFNSIANPFFQTAIKRRIQMLTKIQHPGRAYLSRIIALPLIALIAFAFTVRTKINNSAAIPLRKDIVVVIDAGHGKTSSGSYSGATGGNMYEDEIVLKLARAIQEGNTNEKIKIILTRNDENNVDLKDRLAIVTKSNADLFISLHLNALPPARLSHGTATETPGSGIEFYVPSKNPSQEDNSVVLGSAIAGQLTSVYKTKNEMMRSAGGVYVLNTSPCPAVLIECGFITDEKDRSFVASRKNQQLIAQKILKGIELYAASVQEPAGASGLTDTIPGKNKSGILITPVTTNHADSLQPLDALINTKKFEGIIVVDGKVSNTNLNSIKAYEIESVNVIKSAAGEKKYGEKGKNGVIEITMKNRAAVQEKAEIREKTEGRQVLKPLYVLEGKELNEEEIKKLDPNTISSINVLKGKTAIDKYGVKGENGVVEITSKKPTGSAGSIFVAPVIAKEGDGSVQPRRDVMADGKKFAGIYVVDGEIYNDDINKIPAENIQSMNILKGKTATDKWGDRGKNGVIEITMKKSTRNKVTIRENNKNTGMATGEINTNSQEFHGTVETGAQTDNSPVFEQSETGASVDPVAWRQFLETQLRPVVEEVSKSAGNGKYLVNLRFIVNTDGSVSDCKALNDPGYKIAPKVIEIMKYSPKWKPAVQNGKLVRSYHTQPITLVVGNP